MMGKYRKAKFLNADVCALSSEMFCFITMNHPETGLEKAIVIIGNITMRFQVKRSESRLKQP